MPSADTLRQSHVKRKQHKRLNDLQSDDDRDSTDDEDDDESFSDDDMPRFFYGRTPDSPEVSRSRRDVKHHSEDGQPDDSEFDD
jgi:hypothetical protein